MGEGKDGGDSRDNFTAQGGLERTQKMAMARGKGTFMKKVSGPRDKFSPQPNFQSYNYCSAKNCLADCLLAIEMVYPG